MVAVTQELHPASLQQLGAECLEIIFDPLFRKLFLVNRLTDGVQGMDFLFNCGQ